jgi:broad specificity phosphatase PhoE
MYLYLIRHGESRHNAVGRIQGHSDVRLSDLGRRQAAAAAELLVGKSIDVLHASPLRRARETAEIVAERLRLPIRFDDRLKEVNVGIFQDHLRSELESLYPEEFVRWKSEDFDYVIPGGESRRQLLKRGREVLHAIVETGLHGTAIVSHGRILMTVVKDLLGIPLEKPPFSLQNGSITTLSYDENDKTFSLVALDDVEHLRDVGLSGSGDL